jgi:energy-converting hydrogenase Eha subunit C
LNGVDVTPRCVINFGKAAHTRRAHKDISILEKTGMLAAIAEQRSLKIASPCRACDPVMADHC